MMGHCWTEPEYNLVSSTERCNDCILLWRKQNSTADHSIKISYSAAPAAPSAAVSSSEEEGEELRGAAVTLATVVARLPRQLLAIRGAGRVTTRSSLFGGRFSTSNDPETVLLLVSKRRTHSTREGQLRKYKDMVQLKTVAERSLKRFAARIFLVDDVTDPNCKLNKEGSWYSKLYEYREALRK